MSARVEILANLSLVPTVRLRLPAAQLVRWAT